MSVLGHDLRKWVESETRSAVVGATRLGHGASRLTWSVDLLDGRSLVVREDPGTGPVAGTPLTLTREAAVYGALASAPVPVPALLATSPDGSALLFERVPGTEGFSSVSADERTKVARHFGGCLGRLHQLAPADLDLGPLEYSDEKGPTHADIGLWQSIREARTNANATPVTAPALGWLAAQIPDETVSLCHGDAGPGNFLHDGGAVTALLDWEFAHLGDAHDDLAWVAVRNQLVGRPLALDDAYAGWRETTGADIDLGRVEYYRALVLVRMAISCDAALEWTGGKVTPDTRVQAALRPFLAPAIIEALRRTGCRDTFLDDFEGPARAEWEQSPIKAVLGDPSDLDDLGPGE